ncbi:hypothetical protein IFU30_10820 [Plantibacter sp. CFBP 8798]|uniref:DUF7882 family protein n=1 Tax=Plantibacter sp. CFBP 8798 TaxID=2775268 RepID=UPI001786F652|nr:hypothetical protein [Plantibacter sp. CFBP 8798]MBD8466760.1 hypothetical protein [Plantibacter sp. CFBP 8798]
MGMLIYGSGDEYEIEDRALAHLKAVIGAKLRRQESFFLSWANDSEHGSGRRSLWLSPSIPLQFRFFGSRPPELNRAWLEVLSDSSHTPRGLQLIPESDVEGYLAGNGAPRDAGTESHDQDHG